MVMAIYELSHSEHSVSRWEQPHAIGIDLRDPGLFWILYSALYMRLMGMILMDWNEWACVSMVHMLCPRRDNEGDEDWGCV